VELEYVHCAGARIVGVDDSCAARVPSSSMEETSF